MRSSVCPSLRLLEILVKDQTRRRDIPTKKSRSEVWSTTNRVQLTQVLVDRHLKLCPVCNQKIASEGALASFKKAF